MNLLEFQHTLKTLENIVYTGGNNEAVYKHLRRAKINVNREQADIVHLELTTRLNRNRRTPDSYIITGISEEGEHSSTQVGHSESASALAEAMIDSGYSDVKVEEVYE